MNSYELMDKGFKEWYDFNFNNKKELERKLENIEAPAVFVIRNCKSFGRFFGESDIVYIGNATAEGNRERVLYSRILQCFNPGPTQKTNQRIFQLLQELSTLQISWVTVSSPEDAKNLKKELLKLYELDHKELPPLNRQE
ncbi:MAG: hypothetical protein ABDH23_07410 [Endomicrobiia bacterium]